MTNKKNDDCYLIHYRDPKDGKLTSIKSRKVEDSPLGLSFIKISDFVFETESLVVKPIEEQMKKRFEDVKSFHLSIYSVVSIEELGPSHSGLKFSKDKGQLLILNNDEPGPGKH